MTGRPFFTPDPNGWSAGLMFFRRYSIVVFSHKRRA